MTEHDESFYKKMYESARAVVKHFVALDPVIDSNYNGITDRLIFDEFDKLNGEDIDGKED